MALTAFQRGICRLLAPSRIERDSYIAGGVALNVLLKAPRRSRDIDLFHDAMEALRVSVDQDAKLLAEAGYTVRFIRQAPAFAEAMVEQESQSVLLQWACDSAFRFFPLVQDEDLGLALHPFDLATNKALAMAGRLEPRDWIDLMTCHQRLQPLGYLVWAACGKDPGYNPRSLLNEMRRASHYAQEELNLLDFDGPAPDAARLGKQWHAMLHQAEAICQTLPAENAGSCVCTRESDLCRLPPDELASALPADQIRFHHGAIGGAWPTFAPVG